MIAISRLIIIIAMRIWYLKTMNEEQVNRKIVLFCPMMIAVSDLPKI